MPFGRVRLLFSWYFYRKHARLTGSGKGPGGMSHAQSNDKMRPCMADELIGLPMLIQKGSVDEC